MGEVWLAEDTRLRRRVALKMVRPAVGQDAASRERLMREARAAAALNHPHIATVHDVLEQDGDVVIVFEYVEGETLHARIARGAIAAGDAIDLATQIAKALSAAHAHGIVHRDLKPANVIIGADNHVKVLDFGIARMLAVGTTQTSPDGAPSTSSGLGFIGTASYAAPEQMVSSAVDERADLYALGVVLFEMLSGRRPFQGSDPIQLASTKLGKEAPSLSSTGQLVAPALEQLVALLLARERDRRPASAKDVVARLRAISGDKGTGPLPEPRPRNPLIAIAAVVLIVVVAGFGLREIRRFTNAPAATNTSAPPVIAVLPLSNMSGDASKDFIAAGIAESLISSLAAVPSVTVLSRSSVTEAHNRIKDSAALTKDLGATFLVDGSVQQSGETLRVSLSLIRSDQSVEWGDTIEGTFDRIFELQSRLATALTSALVVRVSASERQRMVAQPTTSPEALSAYWQGKALLERGDVKGNVAAAQSAFERAVKIDPKFALAHAGLGQVYQRQYRETKDPAIAQRAIDAATNALRLDSNQAEVRYVLALTLAGAGRLDEAIDELHHSLALQPNYEDARRFLGSVLTDKGDIDAAVVEFHKAISLRPQSPSAYTTMGLAMLRAARYKDAADAFERALQLSPDNFASYQQLGTAYQFLGNNTRALENYRQAIKIRASAPAYSNIGALLHQQGDFTGAVEAYRQAIAIRPNSAITHRNLGDALQRLGRTADARASYLEAMRLFEIDLQVNPNDPRAIALLAVVAQKAGKPDEATRRISEALKIAPAHPEVLYRAAALSALSGQSSAALAYLEKSVKAGYSKARILEDDDLSSIRGTEQFRLLTASSDKEKP
jgi:serine/threonine protein kinase/Tfp pilus assembly protein PilF